MLDLDHFKRINDKFGHVSGDAVLKEVASCIASAVRDNDKVGRYGGEEFIVILPSTNLAKGTDVAERIREGVGALHWRQVTADLRVTVSCGITEVLPTDTLESVVARADAALYQTKHKGRNRIDSMAVYSAEIGTGGDNRRLGTGLGSDDAWGQVYYESRVQCAPHHPLPLEEGGFESL